MSDLQTLERNITQVITVLFPQFDRNNSQTLDITEIGNFLNQTFRALGYNINLSQQDAANALRKIDTSFDQAAGKQ
jgi:hypothetical protein